MFAPSYGVIIGKFQTPYLHEGHCELINEVLSRHQEVVILVGDRPSPATAQLTLSYEIRARMIRSKFPEVTVLRLEDQPNNEVWTAKLDALVDAVCGGKATLYCSRDGFISCYSGRHMVKEIQSSNPDLCATDIRKSIYVNGPDWVNSFESERVYDDPTVAFRAGMIYQMGSLHSRQYTTVDMALIKRDEFGTPKEILLAQKTTDGKFWRLPGGFVEPGESYREAAGREMSEETGMISETPWEYVGDYSIKDWRIRGQHDVSHRTVLMLGNYLCGKAEAKDDVANVKWFNLEQVAIDRNVWLVPDHRLLVWDVYTKLVLENTKIFSGTKKLLSSPGVSVSGN